MEPDCKRCSAAGAEPCPDACKREGGAPDVPYIVYEAERARHERTLHRVFILCAILGVALIATGAALIMQLV